MDQNTSDKHPQTTRGYTTRSKRDRLHYQKHAWQAVHLGEYKIHPHKTKVRSQLEKLVTIKHFSRKRKQPQNKVAFIIYNQKNQVKHTPMYKPLLV